MALLWRGGYSGKAQWTLGLVVIGVLCVATGLILDLVAHVRRETKRLAYLAYPAPRPRVGNSRNRAGPV